MLFHCRKVRAISASYTMGTARPVPKNGWQVMLVPVESQHDVEAGLVEMHIWLFESCPFVEGKRYNIPWDLTTVTEVVPKTSYEEKHL